MRQQVDAFTLGLRSNGPLFVVFDLGVKAVNCHGVLVLLRAALAICECWLQRLCRCWGFSYAANSEHLCIEANSFCSASLAIAVS